MDYRSIITLNTATWSLYFKNAVTKTLKLQDVQLCLWDVGGQDGEMSYLFYVLPLYWQVEKMQH